MAGTAGTNSNNVPPGRAISHACRSNSLSRSMCSSTFTAMRESADSGDAEPFRYPFTAVAFGRFARRPERRGKLLSLGSIAMSRLTCGSVSRSWEKVPVPAPTSMTSPPTYGENLRSSQR